MTIRCLGRLVVVMEIFNARRLVSMAGCSRSIKLASQSIFTQFFTDNALKHTRYLKCYISYCINARQALALACFGIHTLTIIFNIAMIMIHRSCIPPIAKLIRGQWMPVCGNLTEHFLLCFCAGDSFEPAQLYWFMPAWLWLRVHSLCLSNVGTYNGQVGLVKNYVLQWIR